MIALKTILWKIKKFEFLRNIKIRFGESKISHKKTKKNLIIQKLQNYMGNNENTKNLLIKFGQRENIHNFVKSIKLK